MKETVGFFINDLDILEKLDATFLVNEDNLVFREFSTSNSMVVFKEPKENNDKHFKEILCSNITDISSFHSIVFVKEILRKPKGREIFKSYERSGDISDLQNSFKPTFNELKTVREIFNDKRIIFGKLILISKYNY